MNKAIHRNNLILAIVVTFLIEVLCTACSANVSQSADVEKEVVRVETKDETIAVEEVAEVEPTPEPTLEPTPELTLDMNSTLPGVEWVQTFDGIVDEPKLIVFNDETNKKVILENWGEVEFYDDDTLALYIPRNRGKITDDFISESYEEIAYYDNIVTFRKIPSIISRGGYSSARFIDIEFDGSPMRLYYSLKLMG